MSRVCYNYDHPQTNTTFTGREPGQLLVASLTFFSLPRICTKQAVHHKAGKARALVSKAEDKVPQKKKPEKTHASSLTWASSKPSHEA